MSGAGLRPAYPPATEVLVRAAFNYVRVIFLGIALVVLMEPCGRAASQLLDERSVVCFGLILVHSGVWVLINGGLSIAEYLNIEVIARCKIGRKKAEVATTKLTRRLYIEMAINHLVTSPLLAYFVLFPLSKRFEAPAPDAPLPCVAAQALSFAAAFTINEWGFCECRRMQTAALAPTQP